MRDTNQRKKSPRVSAIFLLSSSIGSAIPVFHNLLHLLIQQERSSCAIQSNSMIINLIVQFKKNFIKGNLYDYHQFYSKRKIASIYNWTLQ